MDYIAEIWEGLKNQFPIIEDSQSATTHKGISVVVMTLASLGALACITSLVLGIIAGAPGAVIGGILGAAFCIIATLISRDIYVLSAHEAAKQTLSFQGAKSMVTNPSLLFPKLIEYK